jgi:hypothetical protein
MSPPRVHRFSLAAAILIAHAASAQPSSGVPAPSPAAPPSPAPASSSAAPTSSSAAPASSPAAPPPLAQVKDDKQLAEILSSITQDPAIPVDNPATRPLAQALMTEGVKQLQARAFDQALANFLEAYAKFPSPKILLNVASTLRDMGRLADAANTYQRYLSDPATGAERVAEVKDLLLRLDEQLTILTVRVSPHGASISIDGGPFIPVGSTLVTRVRTGLHLVRVRKEDQNNEQTINGFEGENKEVASKLAPPGERPPTLVAGGTPSPGKASAPGTPAIPPSTQPIRGDTQDVPDRVDGWLITGTQYGASNASSRERTVRSARDGRMISAIVPRYDVSDSTDADTGVRDDEIESGALGVLRIDGKGRGFAGGVGLALSRGRLELEIMGLLSDQFGGYVGGRYRLLTGFFRPYLAVGVPAFVYDHEETQGMMTTTTKRVSIGGRVAAGLEIKINGHLSVQGDIGYEHFYFVDDRFEETVLVPTLGVIGRL